jgi:DHA1 family inner membrane transport protein
MSVAAYNAGTAVGSGLAGRALDSGLGATGPAVVGTGIAVLTLLPVLAVAALQRRSRTGGTS